MKKLISYLNIVDNIFRQSSESIATLGSSLYLSLSSGGRRIKSQDTTTLETQGFLYFMKQFNADFKFFSHLCIA